MFNLLVSLILSLMPQPKPTYGVYLELDLASVTHVPKDWKVPRNFTHRVTPPGNEKGKLQLHRERESGCT